MGGGAQARVQWRLGGGGGAQALFQWGLGGRGAGAGSMGRGGTGAGPMGRGGTGILLEKLLYIYLRAKVIVLLKAGANMTTDNDDRMSYYGKGHVHRQQTKYRHKHAL